MIAPGGVCAALLARIQPLSDELLAMSDDRVELLDPNGERVSVVVRCQEALEYQGCLRRLRIDAHGVTVSAGALAANVRVEDAQAHQLPDWCFDGDHPASTLPYTFSPHYIY